MGNRSLLSGNYLEREGGKRRETDIIGSEMEVGAAWNGSSLWSFSAVIAQYFNHRTSACIDLVLHVFEISVITMNACAFQPPEYVSAFMHSFF